MKQTFFVSLDIEAAANLIDRAVVDKSITGQCIDTYTLDSESSQCRVMVYEKHFLRVSNRLTLTVVIDNFDGKTRVHCVSGGGGDALLGCVRSVCRRGRKGTVGVHYITFYLGGDKDNEEDHRVVTGSGGRECADWLRARAGRDSG